MRETETILMENRNKVLEVKPSQKEYYMNKGYSVIDEHGEVIERAMPVDVNELQNKVRELEDIVSQKNSQIAMLVAEREQLLEKVNSKRGKSTK